VHFVGKVKASAREFWREKILLFIALFIVVATIAFFAFSNTFESRNDFYQAHDLHPVQKNQSMFPLDVFKLSVPVLFILDTLIIWGWNSIVVLLNRYFYHFLVKVPAFPNLGMELSLFFRTSATALPAHDTLRLVVLVGYSVVEATLDLFWKLVCTKEIIVIIRKYRKYNSKVWVEYLDGSHVKGMYLLYMLLLLPCAISESLCVHVLQ
jgi:hypothetical protein